MTTSLEGGEWSAARPGCTLPPGKIRYPFYRRLGGPQGRSGQVKNLVPTRIRSRTVQPVVSHYTDWATRPTGGQGWLDFILCISNRISCKGPPCVGIGNKLVEYPSSIGSVLCSYLRCENILPLELHSLCVCVYIYMCVCVCVCVCVYMCVCVCVLQLSCVWCQDGSPQWTIFCIDKLRRPCSVSLQHIL